MCSKQPARTNDGHRRERRSARYDVRFCDCERLLWSSSNDSGGSTPAAQWVESPPTCGVPRMRRDETNSSLPRHARRSHTVPSAVWSRSTTCAIDRRGSLPTARSLISVASGYDTSIRHTFRTTGKRGVFSSKRPQPRRHRAADARAHARLLDTDPVRRVSPQARRCVRLDEQTRLN